MKTCIIDCGGGNRGIYGAGVFERLLDEEILFDCCIGVSAGSGNVATYLARQKGRLYTFYHDYAFRKEYMSFHNVLKHREFVGLNYIYRTLSNSDGENPLDIAQLKKYTGKLELLVTEALTGKARHMGLDDLEPDDYWVLHASCCLPVICRPVRRNGVIYYDGGVADPVPIERALAAGYDRIVLILSRPVQTIVTPGIEALGSKLIYRKFPVIGKMLAGRADHYNASVRIAVQAEKEGKCMIVAPKECFGVDTLKKTPEGLDALYKEAYADAGAIRKYIETGAYA